MPLFKTDSFKKPDKPLPLTNVECPQPVLGQGAVFVDQGYDIADGSDTDQIESSGHDTFRQSCLRRDCLRHFKSNAYSGQILKRIWTSRLYGIDHRTAGYPFSHSVMIRDQQLQSDALRILSLFTGNASAVDGNDQIRSVFFDLLQGSAVQAVPFVESRRYVVSQIFRQIGQDFQHQRRRCDAVGIVVAVDTDLFPPVNGGQY